MNSDYWKGPAEVIGKDYHEVIVKHGGSPIKVYPVSLCLADKQIAYRDMAGEIAGIESTEEDNADDNRIDEITDAGDMEDISVENADDK